MGLKTPSVWITTLALALWLVGTHAHSQMAPVLISDQVSYDDQTQLFIATGHVEVYFDGAKLVAPTVTFDQLNDRFSIEGPFVLVDPSGSSVTYGQFADLSSDLADGVIYAVNQIIEENLQVSANKVIRSGGSVTQFDRVRASSCRVCSTSDIPLWEVRAREAVHDDEAKTVTFRHAQLRIRDVPVAYTPWLRLPDPSVKRSDGLLGPVLSFNSRLGTRVGIPYFKTLGKHADLTVTPYLGVQAKSIKTLEGRYRQRYYSGFLELNGALSSDDFTTASHRAYLFTNGQFNFENGVDLKFSTQAASDRAYIGTYDFFARERRTLTGEVLAFQDDRLRDDFRISRTSSGELWEFEYAGYKPLRDPSYLYDSPNRIINSQWTREIKLEDLPGSLKFNVAGQLSANEFGPTNSRQMDITRGSVNLSWRDSRDLGGQFKLYSDGGLFWDNYQINDDLNWSRSQSGAGKFIASKLAWPNTFSGFGRGTSVFTPSVQFMHFSTGKILVPIIDGSTIHLVDPFNHSDLSRFRRVNREQDGYGKVSTVEFDFSYRYNFSSNYYLGAGVNQDFLLDSSDVTQKDGRLFTVEFGKSGQGLTYGLSSKFNGAGDRIFDQASFSLPWDPITFWGGYVRQDIDPAYAITSATERWSLDLTARLTQRLSGSLGTTFNPLASDDSFTTGSVKYDDGALWRASAEARYDRTLDRFQKVSAEIRRRTKWGGDVYGQHSFDYDTTSRVGVGLEYSNECASFIASLAQIKNAATGLDETTEFKLELRLGNFGAQNAQSCG